MLSYAYAGAGQVQAALAADTRLACTAGTSIIPLCAAAIETWRRVDGRAGTTSSPLAAAAVRQLINVQVTAILAASGRKRWCEMAIASPADAATFLQLFPHTRFVCVHRACPEVVRAGTQANPWGLQDQLLVPYLLAYAGNSVAALAAYWADSAEDLAAFESAHPGAAHRVRCEDVAAGPDEALAAVRSALGLGTGAGHGGSNQPKPPAGPGQSVPVVPAGGPVPAEMIPGPLRERIGHLHARLGYKPPEGWQ